MGIIIFKSSEFKLVTLVLREFHRNVLENSECYLNVLSGLMSHQQKYYSN